MSLFILSSSAASFLFAFYSALSGCLFCKTPKNNLSIYDKQPTSCHGSLCLCIYWQPLESMSWSFWNEIGRGMVLGRQNVWAWLKRKRDAGYDKETYCALGAVW
jgi:hypothetical protein